MKVTAVVLGAGSGTRMKASVNKVFLEIAGVPVIKRSVDAFLNCKSIDEVVVVCKENDLCEMKKLFCDSPVNFVVGGETRQQSVKNAVESIENCDYIVIHDGARPFVTQTVIESTLADAVKYKAAATGVYVKDTIKVVDKDGFIVSTPDRSSLISIQTPQIFDFDIYKKACENAVKKGINATDDCALVEMQGYNVKVTLGDYNNIKITTPEDLPLGESIVNMR